MTREALSDRALVSRIRTSILVMVLSFFVQGAFLANALRSGDAGAWILWAVSLAVAVFFITIAGIRVVPLSREHRRRTWGT
ncbi:hypothetical protein D8Y23_13730 [Microbacterium enclense]|uniref:Uncharacterized protein n=1 Tax=Microbacterium enclense TaxID=993073 RepID=A0A3S3KV55_9MICO|nr:hypothetical protein [Microbacterium enclense]RWR16350.1 hypothetical protein D8Y23_13730 [Microbacterium enclense]